MYVISEDQFGALIATNGTIKSNLKTWLNNYRMISDTVDILDPYIINLGIDFVVRPAIGADKSAVLANCIGKIKDMYSNNPFFIGEQLLISDIYSGLKDVTDVLDVIKVKITNIAGGQYSPTQFKVNKNISPDGSQLLCPKNAIFEIKYIDSDVRGKIR